MSESEPTSRSVLRKAQRREQILSAARELFVERGYVDVTVDDIALASGIARGTFYLYFSDKLDVFSAIVREFYESVIKQVLSIDLSPGASSPAIQLRQNLERVVATAAADPHSVRLAFGTSGGIDARVDAFLTEFYRDFRVFIDETLAIGQAVGLVRKGDRTIMLSLALGGIEQLLLDVACGNISAETKVTVEGMMDFLAHGLLAGG